MDDLPGPSTEKNDLMAENSPSAVSEIEEGLAFFEKWPIMILLLNFTPISIEIALNIPYVPRGEFEFSSLLYIPVIVFFVLGLFVLVVIWIHSRRYHLFLLLLYAIYGVWMLFLFTDLRNVYSFTISSHVELFNNPAILLGLITNLYILGYFLRLRSVYRRELAKRPDSQTKLKPGMIGSRNSVADPASADFEDSTVPLNEEKKVSTLSELKNDLAILKGISDGAIESYLPEFVIAYDLAPEGNREFTIRLHRPRFLALVHLSDLVEEIPGHDAMEYVEVDDDMRLTICEWIDDPKGVPVYRRLEMLKRAAEQVTAYLDEEIEDDDE